MIPSKVVKPWRPTDKEINRKLASAREAVAQAKYSLLRPDKVYADLANLDIFTNEDLKKGLVAALEEIRSKDYAGSHPPELAYEEDIAKKELFAFSFDSKHFGRRVYLKFVELGNKKGPGLSIVSFHLDRPPVSKRRE